MDIKSLGRRTDLIFAKFSGSVVDRGSYTVIQTPNNPGYHWGNYIVFDQGPQTGSLKEWTSIFDKEFIYYSEPHHYVFTWENGDYAKNEYQEFLQANFELDSATVLSTTHLIPPPYLNERIEVRKVSSDQDWNDVVKLQTLCADPKFMNEQYEQFAQRQVTAYRKMTEARMGSWFGAYIDDELVGNLGIYYEGNVGRYQNVGTHPNHRRKGICGNLVYQAGLLAFQSFGIEHLVMEADLDYHAVRIYESVGFRRTEVNHSLSWWPGKKS